MSQDKNTPPVAFIIFNRPEYTKKVFAEIRAARPRQLFVIADGPRTAAEAALCEQTRAIVADAQIDWPCEVQRDYAEKNLGLKDRISSGLNWFFEHVEEGIILEDDCLPHPSFFRFAGEMLERYRYNERIMMISGDNFLPDFLIAGGYFFSRFFSIWGWATWRRSWKQYDPTMCGWSKKASRKKIASIYPERYMRKHVSKMFSDIHTGAINSWDPQWLYACLMSGGLCIVPSVNLISNIGTSGTHSSGNNQHLQVFDIYDKGDIIHPTMVRQNSEYDHNFYEQNFRPSETSVVSNILRSAKAFGVQFDFIKWCYRSLRAYRNKLSRRLYLPITLPGQTKKRGTVLLSYLAGPFTLLPWQRFTDPHTNYWECSEIARLFSVRGYDVDVIDASNTSFVPHKPYDFVVDVRQNLQRLAKKLPASCKKVMHITSSESGFQNAAEAARLADLKQRRGIVLPAQRVEAGLNNPAFADFLEGFGNKTVHSTYAPFNKPIYQIPISVAQTFDFPERSAKDFAEARKHFLFFSGGGAILKGLCLLVEAFAEMPDLHLHIIGPAASEKGFREAYTRELALPNIHCYPRPRLTKDGNMTVGDAAFTDVTNKCATIIYPSASEGTSGAVVQAMHAGVFPIVTKQTGLGEDAPAIIIENPTVESIRTQARAIATMAPKALEAMARAAWTYAREHHTRETFSAAYGTFIDDILRP